VIYDESLTDAFLLSLKYLLMPPRRILYLALEKRINFCFNDGNFGIFAKSYEYFLQRLQSANFDVAIGGVKRSFSFRAQKLPVNFPQYFNYVRTQELELWQIENGTNLAPLKEE